MAFVIPKIDRLPFLQSVCWQGGAASVDGLTEDELLQLYERNWRYRGVITDLSDTEKTLLHQLATKYHSWLVNELT